MSTENTLSWQDALALLSPNGKAELVSIVRKACDDRGKGWIDAIAEEYPAGVWIADLVANHDATECVAELEKQFGISLGILRGKIFELHTAIRAEIDRPRGKSK